MKIIIKETSEKALLKTLINENAFSEKVAVVKRFLDKDFLKATNSIIDDNGKPKNQGIVIWVDSFKQPKQYLSDVDLFYVVQNEFKNIISDTKERDKFLKQCIKDWYHNKISKYDNLSLYEAANMSNFGKNRNSVVKGDMMASINDIIELAHQKESIEMKFQDWNDISIDGTQIINDINRELAYFNKKKSNTKLSKNVLICDRTAGLNSPDVYMLIKMIYTSRSAFKWCIMCPNLAKGLDLETLNFLKNQINGVKCDNGQSYYFKSKQERDLCLPFLAYIMRTKQASFVKSDLRNEVMQATEMTYELNIKVEKFLDSIGFEETKLKPEMLGQKNNTTISSDDDLDDF